MSQVNDDIKISIITSLYRCSAFLQQFLHYYSKIENIDECELILIHNDPTNPELDILANGITSRMNLNHIVVEREGLYSSWNRAIKIARGKYMAVWNVDDIRTPESLASQLAALESSGAALCYGDFYGTRRYGVIKEHLYEYGQYADLKKETFRTHVIGCFPMWRKDIHQAIGYFDEQYKLVGDFEFQLRVAVTYSLVKADSLLGYYLEYAAHKLSSNKLLQHSERTSVQLRYKMYDKLLLHFLPFISKFRVFQVKSFGEWFDIHTILPDLKNRNHHAFQRLIKLPFLYSYWFVWWSSKTVVNRTIRRNINRRLN